MLVIARRALVRLVRDLRKKKSDGDERGFMDLVLDAANSANGNLASVAMELREGEVSQEANLAPGSEESHFQFDGLPHLPSI